MPRQSFAPSTANGCHGMKWTSGSPGGRQRAFAGGAAGSRSVKGRSGAVCVCV